MLFIHVTNKNLSSFIYFKLTIFTFFFPLLHISHLFYFPFLLLLSFSHSILRKNQICAALHDYVGNIWPVAKFRFTIKISCASDFAKNISGGWIHYKCYLSEVPIFQRQEECESMCKCTTVNKIENIWTCYTEVNLNDVLFTKTSYCNCTAASVAFKIAHL